MEIAELKQLSNEYAAAFRAALSAKYAEADARAELDLARACAIEDAYTNGVINGKNAEIRKVQSEIAAAESDITLDALEDLMKARRAYIEAEAERVRLQTLIDLLKAGVQNAPQ